jgi:hypothetical protein
LNALRPASKGQTRALVPAQQLDAATMLHAAQDGDEAVGAKFFQQELVDEFFLFGIVAEKAIRRVGLLRERLSKLDEALRKRLDEGQEVLAFDFEAVINEAVEMVVATEGQMAVKNHLIMAAEDRYNGGRESFDKTVHGVLLPVAVW